MIGNGREKKSGGHGIEMEEEGRRRRCDVESRI
jgi:hypothetical protein